MDLAGSPWFLPLAGLLAGIVIGYAARRHHFCTLSSLERYWYAGESGGVRTWVLGAAVAVAATQVLVWNGLAEPTRSVYLATDLSLGGAVIGGLAFGFGMALVGTCGFGALVRAGGGSLRSLMVLIVLGLSAMAVQRGVLAPLRAGARDVLPLDLSFAGDQSIGSILSAAAGHDLRTAVSVAVVAALLFWVFRDPAFRRRTGSIATAAVIGFAIAFGWLATTHAYHHAFEPVSVKSASFVAPVGDTMLHFILQTGGLPDYGIGLVIGVMIGAALCAVRSRNVRWEACDDARELGRHIAGGFLMGTGGVLAMGCTIGQGVTALSALALSAPIVMASIVVGARVGLAYLIEGSLIAPFRAFPLFHGNRPGRHGSQR